MALGKPKLGTKTPDSDDTNALLVDGLHDKLIRAFRDPKRTNRHYAVVAFAVDEVVTHEGGAEQAKFTLRHIELLDDDTELLAAYQARTNNPALPGDDSANQLAIPGMSLDQAKAAEAADDAKFDAANPKK